MTRTTRQQSEPRGRVEDARLLTGKGRYVDDLKLEGQAYMGLVRSPYAHAKIRRIDFTKASSSPDFICCLTGEDIVKEGLRPLQQNPWPFQKRARRYHLAVETVRFQGEPVAAILASKKSMLEDLIELVEVEYDVLPVVTTIEESKKGSVLVYEDWGNNLSLTSDLRRGNADGAVASAAHVIHAREGIARQASAPIEPHSVLVAYDSEKESYDVWATVQSVHGTRDKLASELNLPKEKFHVRVMDVGGGFGSKGAQSYPEAPLACIFARRTGLPVKWTATRSEEFLEASAGRDEYCDVTLACDADGRIVALRARVECDSGVTGTQAHMPSMTIETMLGPYNIPNYDLTVAAYATNKMPLGPVRGAGGPEGCYFIERAVDALAKKMGMDPIEFRRRNVSRAMTEREEEERKSEKKKEEEATGSHGEDYGRILDALVVSSQYKRLLRWRSDMQSKFRQTGPSHSSLVGGLGVSLTGSDEGDGGEEEEKDWGGGSSWSKAKGEEEGAQPSQTGGSWTDWKNDRQPGEPGKAQWSGSGGAEEWQRSGRSAGEGSWSAAGEEEEEDSLDFMSETARVTVDKTGRLRVYTGSSPHGQGEETTFAQLASEELGLPLSAITVVWGDTVLIPQGVGTYGSRSAATGGSAVVDAARKLRSQLLLNASEMTGVDARLLDVRDGGVVNVSTHPGTAALLSVKEILQRQGLDELSASSVFTLSATSYSSGAHLCALTLDAELGTVRIVKYVVVEDCGRMINKKIVEGQLHGGVLHGIGGALFERLAYDKQGNLLCSTFTDYNIPTASESPNVEVYHEVSPSEVTLDGAKGVGESGTFASYAAVINALNDALSQVRPGMAINMVPATPDSIFSVLNQESTSPDAPREQR